MLFGYNPLYFINLMTISRILIVLLLCLAVLGIIPVVIFHYFKVFGQDYEASMMSWQSPLSNKVPKSHMLSLDPLSVRPTFMLS
jgi:Na+/glutamate symporter